MSGPTATEQAWWRTAPNPSCSPWCEVEHASDAFSAYGAALTCRKYFMTTPESTVQVEQHHNAGDEPGAIESSELFVFVDSTLDEDDLTAEQARAWLVAREAIATAVREAVEFIEEQQ